VNNLLPDGRVGGELVCYRLMRRQGVRAAPAAGGLIADVALSLVSQLLFALLGLALLALGGATLGWGALIAGLLGGFVLAGATIMVLRASLLGRVIAAINALAKDRLAGMAEGARRLDTYLRRLWSRPRAPLLCTGWQFLAWLAGGLEIWVGCRVLGVEIGLADALMIEALIQALASAAFIVPGALGVQEAGFVGLAVLAGLEPSMGAALAVTRRFRDLVLYLPGLLAWAWAEHRPAA
jgi:putative membrane protein